MWPLVKPQTHVDIWCHIMKTDLLGGALETSGSCPFRRADHRGTIQRVFRAIPKYVLYVSASIESLSRFFFPGFGKLYNLTIVFILYCAAWTGLQFLHYESWGEVIKGIVVDSCLLLGRIYVAWPFSPHSRCVFESYIYIYLYMYIYI